ncbi:hypothetical protein RHSIM_Rhsim12G0094200 [Rhododendron simsii]|uniref:ATP-dependent DNA helicase n=1 Tax=Rhododendron simsii TaxID=118357 RepID=A0A834G411_RHOSS|nr:hypothetical protein RHSIM_Rhsim12G0094200 [Rhododendron simsii]
MTSTSIEIPTNSPKRAMVSHAFESSSVVVLPKTPNLRNYSASTRTPITVDSMLCHQEPYTCQHSIPHIEESVAMPSIAMDEPEMCHPSMPPRNLEEEFLAVATVHAPHAQLLDKELLAMPSTSLAPILRLPHGNQFNDDELEDESTNIGVDPQANGYLNRHYLGRMDVSCFHCKALHWMGERLTNSSLIHPRFGTCCLQGKIKLPSLIAPPLALQELYDGNDERSKSFRHHTREYNATNAFTSLGAKLDTRMLNGRGPLSFTIPGELRHRTGSLLPQPGHEAIYSQLYIYDPESALNARNNKNPHLRRDVLKTIQDCLLTFNPFPEKFLRAFEILNQSESVGQNLPAYLHYSSSTDRWRYNLPTANEIAIILPGDGTEKSGMRDIVLHLRGNNGLMRFNECHPAYLPLHYVLLFPRGELGWEPEMRHRDDSMAITRHNQHPDIFLTMTANPNWPEITEALLPYQKAVDRPDLVARVFELKRKCLMSEIKKKQVFGKIVGYVYTIEYQKRGLPHMYLLLFLEGPDKIHICAQVDKLVCAEFPDPIEDPSLFDTVKGCMVHGPCGARNPQAACMENEKCTKKYPQAFSETTTMDQDGYPIYRRRNDGQVYIVGGHPVDNRDVVPYNAYLSRLFNCHINVEVCAGMRCVKYIHKYIYKANDRATMVLGPIDEIKEYLDERYIGPVEAAWRLFGYSMHEEIPTVVHLALHLPGKHNSLFNTEESMHDIVARAEQEITTLTGFFAYCRANEDARVFTYQEFPQHFVWIKSQKMWKPRERGFAIGRMYFVSPNAGELFYLRLLLSVVRGPESYKCLRTVNNILHDTFKSACIARGLLEDDEEWVQCLEEAAIMKTGYQLHANINVESLNEEQRAAYTAITTSVFENKGKTFFLNGGAGTGKTFLYNTVAIKCRSLGHVVVSIASSGRVVRKTRLIIWDEVPMQHRYCVEAVNRTLQDICDNNKSFGGITVVLEGDFRQILPVIPKGVREQIVGASLRRSVLWNGMHILTLSLNMRLNSIDLANSNFAEFLNQIGTNPVEVVELPSTIQKCGSVSELLFTVYPQLNVVGTVTPTFLNERTILSARNDDVSAINLAALNVFPGDTATYFAADKMSFDDAHDRTITNRYLIWNCLLGLDSGCEDDRALTEVLSSMVMCVWKP